MSMDEPFEVTLPDGETISVGQWEFDWLSRLQHTRNSATDELDFQDKPYNDALSLILRGRADEARKAVDDLRKPTDFDRFIERQGLRREHKCDERTTQAVIDLLNEGVRHVATASADEWWADQREADAGEGFAVQYLDTPKRVPLGIRHVDAALDGGIPGAGMTIIAAEPGRGKTAASIWGAYESARRGERPTYISIEMSRFDVLCRLVSVHSIRTEGLDRVGWSDPLSGSVGMEDFDSDEYRKLSPAERMELADRYFAEHGDSDPFARAWLDFKSTIYQGMVIRDSVSELDEIIALIERNADHGITGPVFIDYCQLVQTSDRDEYERVTSVSRGLQAVAKRCCVPVVLISSLRKDAQKDSNGTPAASALRGSGYLFYDASCVLMVEFIRNEDKLGEIQLQRWSVAKNRRGRAGGYCEVSFCGEFNSFFCY